VGLGLDRAGGAARLIERDGMLVDPSRADRQLPFTVWEPDEPGRHPLVLYSHASYGGRRQSSFLATHLASHGYVVAAVDHTGNTAAEWAARAERIAAGRPLTPAEGEAYLNRIIADRVPDLRFLLDAVLSGAAGGVADRVDPERVGLVGWSFGGWAVLAAPETDDRFRAVLALAPGGSSNPLPGIIPSTLTFAWKRAVPTMILAAERDRFIPLPNVRNVFDRAPSPKRMFVLGGADHGHFSDDVGDEAACTREHAHDFTRTLGLAHFDAALNGDPAAIRFLANDPAAALRARGVDATEAMP
jgi:predicted dienelactone hydrolase